ncbi:unnamed protein product, partial [Pleuronectes platessa]
MSHKRRSVTGSSRRPSSMLQRDAAEEMQEEAVGQELRRIGDDYNRLLLLRGAAGGRRHVVIHPNQLPQVQQEPTLLLCMGLLLLVIGRLIYMQGGTNLQDHSQCYISRTEAGDAAQSRRWTHRGKSSQKLQSQLDKSKLKRRQTTTEPQRREHDQLNQTAVKQG